MTPVRFVDIGYFADLIFSPRREGSFVVIAPIQTVDCFLDESSDETRKDIFCVGGFVAHRDFWKAMQTLWVSRLDQDGIDYFRTSDCKSLSGPFEKLIRKHGSRSKAHIVADKLRGDLKTIITPYHWMGFALGVPMADYNAVFRVSPSAHLLYLEGDPTEAAFSKLIYLVAESARENAPEFDLAYVIDESSYSGRIADAFKAIKQNHSELASTMRTILPLDDRVTPPLQIADLVASVIKDGTLEHLRTGKPVLLPDNWYGHFEGKFQLTLYDKDSILRDIEATIKDKRRYDGTLAQRVSPPLSKSQRKRRQKVAIMKRSFNATLNPKKNDPK